MSKNIGGDLQTHLVAVRARIKGSGALRTTVFDLGETNNALLAASTLSTTTAQSNNVLANFSSERIAFDIRVLALDEYFTVSNMWAYVKETARSFPQP